MPKSVVRFLLLLSLAIVPFTAAAASPDWQNTGKHLWLQVNQGLNLTTGEAGEDLYLTGSTLTAKGGMAVVAGAATLNPALIPPATGYSTSLPVSAVESKVLIVKVAGGYAQVQVGMGWLGGSGYSSLQIVGWQTAAAQPQPIPTPEPEPEPEPSPEPVQPKREIRLRVGSSSATVNGQAVILDVPPRMEGGRAMVPVRFVGDALGVSFRWDAVARSVSISGAERSVTLWVGQTRVLVNGKEQALDAPPVIVEHRLLVPIRFVSEMMGANLTWNQADQSILITADH